MVKILATLTLLAFSVLAGAFGGGGGPIVDPDGAEVGQMADLVGNDGGPMVDPNGAS
jgi:hypothetical protein